MDETKDKGGVGIYVQMGRLPGQQGHDNGRYLSDIVRYHGANHSSVLEDARVREPPCASYAGLQAVIHGGPISPHSHNGGHNPGRGWLKGDRGGRVKGVKTGGISLGLC